MTEADITEVGHIGLYQLMFLLIAVVLPRPGFRIEQVLEAENPTCPVLAELAVLVAVLARRTRTAAIPRNSSGRVSDSSSGLQTVCRAALATGFPTRGGALIASRAEQ